MPTPRTTPTRGLPWRLLFAVAVVPHGIHADETPITNRNASLAVSVQVLPSTRNPESVSGAMACATASGRWICRPAGADEVRGPDEETAAAEACAGDGLSGDRVCWY